MAKILGIQILGMLFGFFMMYYTFLQLKRKEFTIKEYSFWFNIARALDLFIITGFLFLIFIIFYTYILVRKNQRKLEEVVRNIALKRK